LEEQKRVHDRIERDVSVVRAMTGRVQKALASSSRLRRAILAAAFSGQLVAQDPSDEPASVLLERIRAERSETPPKRRTRRETTV